MPNALIKPKKKEAIRNLKAHCEWYSKELERKNKIIDALFTMIWNHGGKKLQRLAEDIEGYV